MVCRGDLPEARLVRRSYPLSAADREIQAAARALADEHQPAKRGVARLTG